MEKFHRGDYITISLMYNLLGGEHMCYNCGCGRPDDDMGQGNAGVDPGGRSITNKTFQVAAASQGMSEEEAKKEALKLLKKVLNEK